MTGSAGQRRVPANFLSTFDIPLPTLPAQRSIAEILDRAESLRRQRRAAIALLDELTQSIFLDMFGDPVSNSKEWETVLVGETTSCIVRDAISRSPLREIFRGLQSIFHDIIHE